MILVRLRTRPRARRRRTRRRSSSLPRPRSTGRDHEEGQKKARKRRCPRPRPRPRLRRPPPRRRCSSSPSPEDDDDDDLLLPAKQRSRSAPAPRARARTKAAPAAAPRAREVNPAMAFARSLRGWIVSRGGRIVGTDLAQFYKSSAARGLEEVPKGGALKLLRTVAAPAGLRIAQDGPRIVISSVGAVAGPPKPPVAPRRALSDLAADDDEDDATPARRTRRENADVPRHAVDELLKLESNAGSITEGALRKLGRLAGSRVVVGSGAAPADEEKAPDAGPAPSLLPLLTAPAGRRRVVCAGRPPRRPPGAPRPESHRRSAGSGGD